MKTNLPETISDSTSEMAQCQNLSDGPSAADLRTNLHLLRPSEAAEMLGVAQQTLAEWRCSQRYALPWIKVGRSVRYAKEDVVRFLQERRHN